MQIKLSLDSIVCNASYKFRKQKQKEKSSKWGVRTLHQKNDRGQWVWVQMVVLTEIQTAYFYFFTILDICGTSLKTQHHVSHCIASYISFFKTS